ncbi:MAG: hypothetical protein AB1696_11695 [Planctomycetota bacterium]
MTARMILVLGLVLGAAMVAAQEEQTVKIKVWLDDQENGGWGGDHNATHQKDEDGVLLKSGDQSTYGSCFRDLGEIDIDQHPFFVVEVDKAEGAFGCKLTNGTKKDKQVIFHPTPGDRCFVTHLPSQTGWSGKVPLSMGIYCHGQNKSLRVKSILFAARLPKEIADRYDQTRNLIYNSSFELDKPEQPPIQTWHRIGSYLPYETPWRIAAGDAFHGKQCARTAKAGKLMIQREIHARGAGFFTFSVYLKAAKGGHKAKLSVTTYRQGRPFATDTESKDVAVGADWARYDMTIDVPIVRGRTGATDLTVESLEDGELCADAMQYEEGKAPTLYGPNRTLMSYEPVSNLRSPLYKPVEEPAAPADPPQRDPGTIKLSPLGGDTPPAVGWPMIGTVTLPQGVSYDITTWRLKTPDGQYIPIQTRVLARWKGDGSIKAGQIIAESDGSSDWAIEYNSKVPAPVVEKPTRLKEPPSITMGRVLWMTSIDGREFGNEEKPPMVRLEENGPLRNVIRVEGTHKSADGEQLLSYVHRTHAYRKLYSEFPNFTRNEYTWINTNASATALIRSMECRIPLAEMKGAVLFGADGKAHEIDPAKGGSLLQCDEDKKYFYEIRQGDGKPERFEGKAEGRVRVDLGDNVFDLLVQDWWQNHPMEIAVDKDAITIYFWSPRLKSVELTKGMAKTYIVDTWHGPKDKAPKKMAGPTQLVAPTSVHCRSGVFGGTILPSEGSPFPIFEKAVNSRNCRARMDPDVMLETDSYGQFNYGDCMGDGGWANLETQRGHSEWLHYFRTGDPRIFAVAQAAARHYRDIDINQLSGGTYVHNPSHTFSGESTSHAWIQCMLDHYLTTGERRSMEVSLLHADFLKKMPLESITHGGREVTRILDNMADIYMLTGDDELIKKYHEIVAAQRENLKKGKSEFPGVFQAERDGKWTYPANFVPWYGLYSMVKMRLATGDPSWENALAEEIGYAMAKLPYEYAHPEFFEGNDLTSDQRIVRCMAEGAIGDRGCMLFPALGYAYRWTKDKRYLDIGMVTTYIAIVSREYTDPLYALAGVFLDQAREAGMGAEDEKRYHQEAIAIMKRAARPALSNPGFEEGRKDWKAWSAKSSTSSYWVPVRDKCMVMDAQIKKEGRQSLHGLIRRDCPPWGSGLPLDSEFFVMDKGKTYTIEGWVRTTGAVSPSVSLSLRPLSPDVEPQSASGQIGQPDADGWRQWKLEITPEADALARLSLNAGRKQAKDEGDVWWDGIAVK